MKLDDADHSVRFRSDNRLHTVRGRLGDWRSGDRWWLDEPCRDCWLVHIATLTPELHRGDCEHGRWWLTRIQAG